MEGGLLSIWGCLLVGSEERGGVRCHGISLVCTRSDQRDFASGGCGLKRTEMCAYVVRGPSGCWDCIC